MPDQTRTSNESNEPELASSPQAAEPNEAVAGTDATRDSTPSTPDSAAQLAALQARVAELTDHVLRAQAEAQNTRRRADEEVAKAHKFALESFASSLLAVVDSLEAALKVENATADQLREGTLATQQQLMGALQRGGVTEINPAPGSRFDPNHEHAISTVPDSGQEPGSIVAVLQKGYLIAERVLRAALVTVAASE